VQKPSSWRRKARDLQILQGFCTRRGCIKFVWAKEGPTSSFLSCEIAPSWTPTTLPPLLRSRRPTFPCWSSGAKTMESFHNLFWKTTGSVYPTQLIWVCQATTLYSCKNQCKCLIPFWNLSLVGTLCSFADVFIIYCTNIKPRYLFLHLGFAARVLCIVVLAFVGVATVVIGGAVLFLALLLFLVLLWRLWNWSLFRCSWIHFSL